MTEVPDQTTFEQALARLDEVVARLEGGDVGLEEAVRLFEHRAKPCWRSAASGWRARSSGSRS